MFNNITLGQYFPGDSFVHRLDPRTKILLIIAIIVMILAVTSIESYCVLAGFFVFLVLLARLNFMRLLRSVKPLWPIILLTMLIHVFSMQPRAESELLHHLQFLDLYIYKDDVIKGILMVTRIVFLILFSSILTMTTSPLELTDGLEKLLRPFKKFGLPAHELAMMMTIALRFIPTLLSETERIMMAQSARGMDFTSAPIMKRVKNILSIIVPLFLSAFRRADELATAMEARCYRGGEGRTRMYQLSFSYIDSIAAIGVAFIGVAMVLAKYYGA